MVALLLFSQHVRLLLIFLLVINMSVMNAANGRVLSLSLLTVNR